MLVLTRKTNEALVIPARDIRVRVVEIRGDKVKLGIEAPEAEAVHREEVWLRIVAEQTEQPGQGGEPCAQQPQHGARKRKSA